MHAGDNVRVFWLSEVASIFGSIELENVVENHVPHARRNQACDLY